MFYSYSHSLSKFFHFSLSLRNKFMKRWINITNSHR